MTKEQKEYDRFLRSVNWQEMGVVMRFIADYRCERCGSPIALDVHHLRYPQWGSETPHDLQVLCRNCHRKAHGR